MRYLEKCRRQWRLKQEKSGWQKQKEEEEREKARKKREKTKKRKEKPKKKNRSKKSSRRIGYLGQRRRSSKVRERSK